jgi:diguanylate cyclase (GGDEF)-like protein
MCPPAGDAMGLRAHSARFPSNRMTARRTISVIVLALAALIGGTLAVVKLTTDHFLHAHAVSIANHWARFVVNNVSDLEEIAAGEQPSAKSMTFFQWSVREGVLYRYEIFNRQGYAQLVADRQRTALVDVSEFRGEAAAAAKTGAMSADVREGDGRGMPELFAEAFVPVVVEGRTIAVVAAYVDQTEERNQVFRSFLVGAAALSALIALAFIIPAAAWYRRTLEKERVDAEIRFLAKHDAMTRLVNRAHLVERMSESVDRAVRAGSGIAVLYLDLDHFKDINDQLGHQAGDTVIKLMGDRIREATRGSDIIARMSGDEFVVVQTEVSDKADAERLARRLLDIMAQPFAAGGHEVVATASIGIALVPDNGRDPERLVRSADLALCKAKSDGRNCSRFFTAELDAELRARLVLEARIREAARDEAFELHYQPLIDVAASRTIGYEALLRLRAADGALLSPAMFVPIAEQIGLIGKIGAWVVREACRTAMQWPDGMTVAVNLSAAQFVDGSICGSVRAALEESGLDPARLQLEITESLLLEDTESVMAQLTQLKEIGAAIVMDDFGTGYSSMSYLWRFPFDKIKIDRTFIQNLEESDKSVETIVRTIIHLGHSLKMRVTVEGVEEARQLDLVHRLGCDEAQGFYFGRPIPACDIAIQLMGEKRRKPGAGGEPRRMLHVVR